MYRVTLKFAISSHLSNLHNSPHLSKMGDSDDYGIPGLVQWLSSPPAPFSAAPNVTHISSKVNVLSNETSGRGVYATQNVSAKETLVRIPHSFLMNTNTIIKHISRFNGKESVPDLGYSVSLPSEYTTDQWTELYAKIPISKWLQLTAFQRTALYICLEKKRKENSFWCAFISSLPKLEELDFAPIVWEVESELTGSKAADFFELLPRSSRNHAKKVSVRFNEDYTAVSEFLTAAKSEPLNKMEFLWAWMCINSRCLYMSFPSSKAEADNFTLAPYVDFLNHDCDEKCAIKIDSRGFSVISCVDHAAGQELLFSYGPHSNEFLLCEYAFTMETNKWNNLDVSHHIEGIMNDAQKSFLREQGYYGDYTISETGGISFRTQVALATIQEREPAQSRRLNSLIQGYNDGESYKSVSKSLIRRILNEVVAECGTMSARLESSKNGRILQIQRLYSDMEHIATVTLDGLEEW
ncbi:hypothetical protein PGUG_04360 [Meyerozyma guilliermondii ATCC 6260]|uniref:SET domain-containing protein n=1 Tax=Meyerozyma guilliermondii (strain ATCC 6260 / CBS 566 / DSM 6381 / JCM 1539 / NBRC 10279 / NRRL Y-324) TaxID=294746 RepID=A5DM59_PICGU|nr:uncharacterized protein PGUG_04360 [Meyerozyma guilliermondii ATCC 6260]EDK40262.2 hypothetical protein PGUG_04360 [Meyerozyma guilliermondii ATCC 6260]